MADARPHSRREPEDAGNRENETAAGGVLRDAARAGRRVVRRGRPPPIRRFRVARRWSGGLPRDVRLDHLLESALRSRADRRRETAIAPRQHPPLVPRDRSRDRGALIAAECGPYACLGTYPYLRLLRAGPTLSYSALIAANRSVRCWEGEGS